MSFSTIHPSVYIGLGCGVGLYALHKWHSKKFQPPIKNTAHSPIILNSSSIMAHTIQPIIKNNRFFNNQKEKFYTHIVDALKIFVATKTSFTNYFSTDATNWIKQDAPINESNECTIQWIGHASFLIQVNGFNIITDPIFYHLNKILYRRKMPVGISPEKLPDIDFILISHNHREHLDEPSITMLKKHNATLLVPIGTKNWFESRGFDKVIEHEWWQTCTFIRNGNQVTFTFVPAAHWSG